MTRLRPGSIPLALILSLTAATAGTGSLSAAGRPDGQTIPVIAGSMRGPVAVSGSNVFAPVASMGLHKGAWSIVAKGFLSSDGSPPDTVGLTTCSLAAGHDSDEIQAFGARKAGSRISFLLNVVHVFASAGRVNLKCASSGSTGDIEANLIRIIAIQAGKLTNVPFGGPSHTTGSGAPRIISVSAAGPVRVSGTNVPGTVKKLRLPKGAWYIMAKFYADSTGGSTRVLCKLVAGDDAGETNFGLHPAGLLADHEPAALDVAHAFSSSGPAKLKCSSRSPNSVEVRSVRITAIRAGQLTTQAMGGAPKTTGSGIPEIVSVHRGSAFNIKGRNSFLPVVSFNLPAGKWALVGTAYLSEGTAADISVTCKLVAGRDQDVAHLVPTISPITGGSGGFELEITHRFSASGRVTLKCRNNASTGQVQVHFARVTTIKAGGLRLADLGGPELLPPPVPGILPGPLRVSPSGHYLVDANGKPFYWQADTLWWLCCPLKISTTELDSYLADRRSKGFDVIQFIAPGDISPANASAWATVDHIVDRAASYGIFSAIVPCWKCLITDPSFADPARIDAYGKFLGARYASRSVIWLLGADYGPRDQAESDRFSALANAIAAGAGGQDNVLMSYHPGFSQSSSRWFQSSSWLDFNTMQAGHQRASQTDYERIAADYRLRPSKPTHEGENFYEDIAESTNWGRHLTSSSYHAQPWDERKQAYWSVFAGGFGYTYGAEGLWDFLAAGQTSYWGGRHPWYEAMQFPGATQLGYLRRLIESRPFLSRIPDQSVVVSNPSCCDSRVQATRGAGGNYAFVYIADGHAISVNMKKITGVTINAWWFDPRTSAVTFIDRFPNTGSRSFTPPTSGSDNDWVLVLDNAAANFPAPGGAAWQS